MVSLNSRNSRFFLLFFSILVFFYFTGGLLLNFSYVDWLSPGDSQYHWINWLFFKETSFFQLPLLKNYNYGMELSTSIALNDSLPIMALIFKPFSDFLPFEFQYFGFWILICFILQGQIAFSMLERITKNQWICLLGSCFFVLSPPFLWRLWGHYALMGHWLIILGIINFYAPKFSYKKWILTIILTSLVNAYILAIVLSLLFFDLICRVWCKEILIKPALLSLSKILLVFFGSLYLFGYFINGLGFGSGGYSAYRANLNTFFNDNGLWSVLIPNVGSIPNDYEGFAFLGIGIILLLALIIIEAVVDRKIIFPSLNKRNTLFLGLSLFWFVFAVTNKITFGTNILFEFDLPNILSIITRPLRSSGRMTWLIFYAIYFFVFFAISRSKRIRLYLFLLPALLVVQAIDMGEAASLFRSKISHTRDYYTNTVGPQTLATLNTFWEPPLGSKEWDIIKMKYEKILYVYPVNRPENAFPLLYFAAKHKLSTNFGYFSRYRSSKKTEVYAELQRQIVNNDYDKIGLYVFGNKIGDDVVWEKTLKNCEATDLCAIIDGYRIFGKDFYK